MLKRLKNLFTKNTLQASKAKHSNLCALQDPLLPSLQSEKGHAMIEMAIGLVFLFNITAGVIDFGSILNDYSAVVEAAHQGALLAATNNHLETNTDQQFGNCRVNQSLNRVTPPSLTEQQAHENIDQRVQRILNIDDSSLENESLCVTSSLENSSAGAQDKNVVVTVEVAYKTLLYGSIPIKAQARAPFLQ